MSVVKVKGGVFTEESQKHLLNVWVMQDYIYFFFYLFKKKKTSGKFIAISSLCSCWFYTVFWRGMWGRVTFKPFSSYFLIYWLCLIINITILLIYIIFYVHLENNDNLCTSPFKEKEKYFNSFHFFTPHVK